MLTSRQGPKATGARAKCKALLGTGSALGFRPISLLSRLVVWVIRGTPLMLQLLIIFYIPGYIFDTTPGASPRGASPRPP